MANNKSCVKMLPSTKNIHEDEFNIKTNESLKLPVLQNGKGVIQNHVDFSKDGNYKLLYGHKFRTYKSTKRNKYATLINQFYPNLNLNELYQLKLKDEEVKLTDLKSMKVCSKCSNVSIYSRK